MMAFYSKLTKMAAENGHVVAGSNFAESQTPFGLLLPCASEISKFNLNVDRNEHRKWSNCTWIELCSPFGLLLTCASKI